MSDTQSDVDLDSDSEGSYAPSEFNNSDLGSDIMDEDFSNLNSTTRPANDGIPSIPGLLFDKDALIPRFPEEITLEIFTYLNEIPLSCLLVSKKWTSLLGEKPVIAGKTVVIQDVEGFKRFFGLNTKRWKEGRDVSTNREKYMEWKGPSFERVETFKLAPGFSLSSSQSPASVLGTDKYFTVTNRNHIISLGNSNPFKPPARLFKNLKTLDLRIDLTKSSNISFLRCFTKTTMGTYSFSPVKFKTDQITHENEFEQQEGGKLISWNKTEEASFVWLIDATSWLHSYEQCTKLRRIAIQKVELRQLNNQTMQQYQRQLIPSHQSPDSTAPITVPSRDTIMWEIVGLSRLISRGYNMLKMLVLPTRSTGVGVADVKDMKDIFEDMLRLRRADTSPEGREMLQYWNQLTVEFSDEW